MITGIILTHNSSIYIKRLLENMSFCGELIIVDDISIDNTLEIAKNHNVRVFKRKLRDFSEQRNFAMLQARGDWILFIDSDEIVTKKLKYHILNAIKSSKYDGYFIRRKDKFFGKFINHGVTANQKIIRLVKKGKGKWERMVHETLKVDGNVGKLNGFIIHHHDRNLSSFISSSDEYSSLHALANEKEGKKSSVIKIILWPIFKFMNLYIIRLGFLDGTRGFIIAALGSFHSYLSWSKQWLKQA